MSFEHQPHPRVAERRAMGPAKTRDHGLDESGVSRFNKRLAVFVCAAVGTMWCAYAFAVLAFLALPSVLGFDWLPSRTLLVVAWVAQTFLQLVLLSVIIVGQNVQSSAADKRAADTFADAEAILHGQAEVHRHLDWLVVQGGASKPKVPVRKRAPRKQ
jgi:hypothetical protein